MDDGTNAVLDAYLFFEGGHWISCGICLAEAEGQWSIDAVNLRLEDWLTKKTAATLLPVGGALSKRSGGCWPQAMDIYMKIYLMTLSFVILYLQVN
jgi:hypothetical protein